MSRLSRKPSEDIRYIVNYPSWVHAEVTYWSVDWVKIRDAIAGEREIKNKGNTYLPQMEGMTDDDYDAYCQRATYYNMCGRTITALTGTLFKRNPVLNGDFTLEDFQTVGRKNTDLLTFMKETGGQQFAVGRYGVLADMDGEGNEPYLVGYIAENIIDWETETIEGREVLTRMVLRETHIQRDDPKSQRKYHAAYRVLELIQNGGVWEYRQDFFVNDTGNADFVDEHRAPGFPMYPNRKGKRFDRIPFVIFGGNTNEFGCEKPPILDIVTLNLSHYRSYAHLEHGRFFTGFPIYYVPTPGDTKAEYTLGPSVVWEVQPNEKPGLLEFNGQGLKFLESALEMKEAQAASLGGRMVGVTTQSVSESDNQVQMKEKNERALLQNVAYVQDTGFTTLCRIILWWRGESDAKVAAFDIETNKDFLLENIGARELRAISAMYRDGHIPIEALYNTCRQAEVVPDSVTLAEFKKLLLNQDSFPNTPDFEARKEGFPDKKTQLQVELKEEELDLEAKEAEKDRAAAEKARVSAENTAAIAAKAAEKTAGENENENPPKNKPGSTDSDEGTTPKLEK